MYQKLLKKDISLVMAITGGGAGAIDLLTKNGGASKILLEAHVPYSAKASSEYAGKEPEHFCSRDHALNLAVSSYNRARAHSTGKPCVGLGSTARLRINHGGREGRVEEAWVAIHDDENTRTYHVSMPYGWRHSQERLLSEIILRTLEDAVGIDNSYDVTTQLGKADSYEDYEKYIVPMVQCKPQIFKHLYEDAPGYYVNIKKKSGLAPNNWFDKSFIVFPGSFNPIHAQHKKMAEVAHKLTGKKVVFELCVKNTDKPPLDYMRLVERYESLSRLYDEPYFGGVMITNTPLFVDKAQVSGFKHFMAGMDTFMRIFNTRHNIDLIKKNKLKFLIFDRKTTYSRWSDDFVKTLVNANGLHETDFEPPFTFVPEDEYVDNGLSSTQLRKESNVH